VLPNGQSTGGVPSRVVPIDATHVRIELTAPTVGSWDVSFEASIGGARVRAMRDLDVTP